jgi:predicted transcriptional regulator
MDESIEEEIECCCIQKQILDQLADSLIPIKAIFLSKKLGLERSIVNKALYGLDRSGKVASTPGKPPLWAYKRKHSHISDREKSLSGIMTKHGIPMSSHSIAYEMQESKTTINRILYDLERDGKVHRLQISPPIWVVSSSQEKKRKFDACAGIEEQVLDTRTNQKKRKHSPHDNADSPPSMKQSHDDGIRNCRELVDPQLAVEISDAVWKKYEHVFLGKNDRQNTVLAGYVVRRTEDGKSGDFEVIALGTGTKCLPGDKYTLDGTTLHDCHAEIIARRSLLRWLYKQLSTVGDDDSFATTCEECIEGFPFVLRPFELWLYTSQCPCGDAAIFSRRDTGNTHKATHCGMFRLKSAEGAGGTAIGICEELQTFDGLQLGDTAKNHTCSDKLAKRCFLGIQGALLSQLVKPLYMTGIVVGDIFAHGPIRRALCCRSQIALTGVDTLNDLYQLHHPRIGNAPLSTRRKMQIEKVRTKLSSNWAAGDKEVEVINATTGRVENGTLSRLSKKSLFERFRSFVPSSSTLTYEKCKSHSLQYHAAKQGWKDAMLLKYKSQWTSKPKEVDDFL